MVNATSLLMQMSDEIDRLSKPQLSNNKYHMTLIMNMQDRTLKVFTCSSRLSAAKPTVTPWGLGCICSLFLALAWQHRGAAIIALATRLFRTSVGQTPSNDSEVSWYLSARNNSMNSVTGEREFFLTWRIFNLGQRSVLSMTGYSVTQFKIWIGRRGMT